MCKWLANFPHLISRERLELTRFLSSNQVPSAYEVLQISRVVILPVDYSSFVTMARHFIASDKYAWLEDCLRVLPNQKCIEIGALASTFIAIT